MSGKALQRITWAVYALLAVLAWNAWALWDTGWSVGALLFSVPITAGVVVLALVALAMLLGLVGTCLLIVRDTFFPWLK